MLYSLGGLVVLVRRGVRHGARVDCLGESQSFRLALLGGVVMGLAALALLAWSDHHLGKNFSHFFRIRSQHDLVQSGTYRWIRHPIYASDALF
jgi:protein-S-isoprenylcysteine O-methyltransferase Ste14